MENTLLTSQNTVVFNFINNFINVDDDKNETEMVSLNIIGKIPCGTPKEEKEHRIGVLDIPRVILGTGDHFILKADGNSMTNIGIEDGDYVIIKRTCEANIDDIVVAMNGNYETTLKTLKFNRQKKCYFLHPEAKGYSDIYPEEIDILGVATMVIKKL